MALRDLWHHVAVKIGRGKSRRKKHKHKDKWHDNCDCDCDFCDLPCIDLMLVSTSLAAAAAIARPLGRRADRLGIAAIRGYRRRISRHLPIRCRFTPSCSAYGLAAVQRYGMADGGRLAADRVRRCRPDVAHGTTDPVP